MTEIHVANVTKSPVKVLRPANLKCHWSILTPYSEDQLLGLLSGTTKGGWCNRLKYFPDTPTLPVTQATTPFLSAYRPKKGSKTGPGVWDRVEEV